MPHKRTIPRVCRQCRADFLADPYEVKRGSAIFCGRPCERASRRPLLGQIDFRDDGSAAIPLRAGDGSVRAYAIIDIADAPLVIDHVWSFSESVGYAHRKVKDALSGKWRTLMLHHVITGIAPDQAHHVDHIDRDRLNCRRSNLRGITPAGNRENVPSYVGSTSRHRGVSWSRRLGKWQAYTQVNGKMNRLGWFTDEDEAGRVAQAARAELMTYAVD